MLVKGATDELGINRRLSNYMPQFRCDKITQPCYAFNHRRDYTMDE